MSQERIEAAANALSEINGMRFDGFWSRLDEMEPEDKEHAIAEARFALERSDPFLFSDEAIERAAVALWNHDFPSSPIENVAELLEWTRGRRLEQARIVVAALKGDA
jgi:hypothetical protein